MDHLLGIANCGDVWAVRDHDDLAAPSHLLYDWYQQLVDRLIVEIFFPKSVPLGNMLI
jgi:hypothetical protein